MEISASYYKRKMVRMRALLKTLLMFIIFASVFHPRDALCEEYKVMSGITVAGIDTSKAVKALHKQEVKEKKKTEKKRKQKIRSDNIDLMARLIYAENGDDSYSEYRKAMLYTGSVVLNRVKSSRYPDTIEDVIYQKGQYQCTWNGHIYKTPSNDAYEIAKKLIDEGSSLPYYVLFAAEFIQGRGVYDKVAGTYYCY